MICTAKLDSFWTIILPLVNVLTFIYLNWQMTLLMRERKEVLAEKMEFYRKQCEMEFHEKN
mgnify:CR=1 FL=1